jgi:hypothetical protein
VDEGIRLGVAVTPAFFTYGQLIVGSSSTHFQIFCQAVSIFPYIDHRCQVCCLLRLHIKRVARLHGASSPQSETPRSQVSMPS